MIFIAIPFFLNSICIHRSPSAPSVMKKTASSRRRTSGPGARSSFPESRKSPAAVPTQVLPLLSSKAAKTLRAGVWECVITCSERSGATIPSPAHGENLFAQGGRGIYLINQLMDEVSIERGGTEIRMLKR